MMRRVAVFGLAVVAGIAMYGCGGSAPEPSSEAAPSPGVEVTPPAADTEIPSSVTPVPAPVEIEPVPAPAEEAPAEEAPAEEAPAAEAPADAAPAEAAPAEEMPAEEAPAEAAGDSAAAAPSVDLETLALKIDPVCKMSIEGIPIVGTAEHEGKTYGFCAALCQKKFEEDPAAILARLAPKPEGAPDK